MITTNNSRYPARIRYTHPNGAELVLETGCGNARRHMIDNLKLIRDIIGYAAQGCESNPMRALFAGCKARVEVTRYAYKLGEAAWNK